MAGLAIQLPAHESQAAFNVERWTEVLNDPFFSTLEQRIETDRHGSIIMTPPPSFSHSYKGSWIIEKLTQLLPDGKAIHEVPISTSDGVRVADVAWLSNEQLSAAQVTPILLQAPSICVEVLSPRNTPREMEDKMALYFDAGAREVWLCEEDGKLRFFSATNEEEEQSILAPGFPLSIQE